MMPHCVSSATSMVCTSSMGTRSSGMSCHLRDTAAAIENVDHATRNV